MVWHTIGWAAGALWTTQGVLLLAELVAAFFPARKDSSAAEAPGISALLLVPARNEASTIAATLRHLDHFLSPSVRGAILCDNCTDDTAAIAARFPRWTIWERHDPAHVGKGPALQEAARRVANDPAPADVIVVTDADSRMTESSLSRLILRCQEARRVVQGRTRLQSCPTQRGSALSALAWWWHNELREQGRANLGWGGFLQGTGMAFPRADFVSLPFFPVSDVEDKTWTVELHRRGRPPVYEPAALWESGVARGHGAWQKQRRRWELGHLRAIRQGLPSVLGALYFRRDPKLLAFAIDFSVPPLFLFLLIGLVGASIFGSPFRLVALGFSASLFILLGLHFSRERIVPLTSLTREIGPWLRMKSGLLLAVGEYFGRRKKSLW